MIGAKTTYSDSDPINLTALDAILAEWNSGNNYATRTANILSGGGATNGNALTGTTVVDDGVANTMTGPTGTGAARNWFIKKKAADNVVGGRSTEAVITL